MPWRRASPSTSTPSGLWTTSSRHYRSRARRTSLTISDTSTKLPTKEACELWRHLNCDVAWSVICDASYLLYLLKALKLFELIYVKLKSFLCTFKSSFCKLMFILINYEMWNNLNVFIFTPLYIIWWKFSLLSLNSFCISFLPHNLLPGMLALWQ